MKAFQNSIKVRNTILARVRSASKDMTLQNRWAAGQGFVAWAVGLESLNTIESEFGIPLKLAALADTIFRGLSASLAKSWPEKFFSSIKPGAALQKAWSAYAVKAIDDPEHGLVAFFTDDEKVLLKIVVKLHKWGRSDREVWELPEFLINKHTEELVGLSCWRSAGPTAINSGKATYMAGSAAAWHASQVANGLAMTTAAYCAVMEGAREPYQHEQYSFAVQSEWFVEALRKCAR